MHACLLAMSSYQILGQWFIFFVLLYHSKAALLSCSALPFACAYPACQPPAAEEPWLS
jgi:hypothetical protein